MTGNLPRTPGPRFVEAVAWAAELHRTHYRKETWIPYLSHLLAVASLVLDEGGTEDEAIAALLHDAIEDQGVTPEEIAARFGPEPARIVAACTDAWEQPKPPWRPRKEAYLAHLETADDAVLRVSLADKLHNARAILLDYRRHGDGLWSRFSVGVEEQLWYYEALADVLCRRSESPLAEELRRTVAELRRLRTRFKMKP